MDDQVKNLLFTNSLLLDRIALGQGKSHEGKRDLYKVFGYEQNIKPEHYRSKYERGDIASRIASAYPDAVWSNPPEILENDEIQDDTEFEKQFKKLAKKLKLWHYVHRADVLAQIGRFSVLFVGVADGQTDLTQPVGTGAPQFLMPFGETHAEISAVESDPTNERYGKPKLYKLTTTSSDGEGETTINVHASRVIHIAERLLDNDTYGISILKSIYNRLQDLEKVLGGGAEVWWMNARGGLHINADKDVTIANPEELKNQIDEYVHKLTRVIRTQGMDVNTLSQTTTSPKDIVSAILDLISGATGIPKRILVGSERGELASSQDQDNWASRVNERRQLFCEPCIVDQILEFFFKIGAIKDIENPIVQWPDLITPSEEKKAEIAVKKASALATYANSIAADQVITPQQFVEEILCEEYREDDLLKMQADEDAEIDASLEEEVVKLPAKKEPPVPAKK